MVFKKITKKVKLELELRTQKYNIIARRAEFFYLQSNFKYVKFLLVNHIYFFLWKQLFLEKRLKMKNLEHLQTSWQAKQLQRSQKDLVIASMIMMKRPWLPVFIFFIICKPIFIAIGFMETDPFNVVTCNTFSFLFFLLTFI